MCCAARRTTYGTYNMHGQPIMGIDTNEVALQAWSACVMALWRSVAYAIVVDE